MSSNLPDGTLKPAFAEQPETSARLRRPGLKDPKFMAVELIMIFFLSGVIMVSFMKIMWASMNIYNANFAIDSLEELYEKMQEDKLTYGNRDHFDNFIIEFENVSFSYGDKKVLENLSFSLEEKKTYALVGHSGSGKSTIAKLLSGFYKVDKGAIKRVKVVFNALTYCNLLFVKLVFWKIYQPSFAVGSM